MKEETALELYKVFEQRRSTALTTYHNHIQHYQTLVLAILSVSIAGVAAVLNLDPVPPELVLCILAGPLVNAPLCWIAIKLCSRPYQIFLETIVVQAKLEPLVGLVGQGQEAAQRDKSTLFPQDENFLPERWVSELQRFPNSREFVTQGLTKGSNRSVRLTFGLLGIINVVLFMIMVAFSVSLVLRP